ncbi:MAG: nucleotide exchange factor GrpE [Pseudonocardiaceae bacterium]
MTGQIRTPPSEQESEGGGGSSVQNAAAQDAAALGTEELAALRSQVQERTEDLQRVTAEYTNYRRRVERDRQAVTEMAKAQVIKELLTVLDDIERAEVHGDLSGPFKAVADKLVAGLATQGLEPFATMGDRFDPDVHEAVQHSTSSEVHQPTVTVVLRRGYRFGERVLRPAMVVVTEPSIPEPSSADPGETSRDAATFHASDVPGAPGADTPTADTPTADSADAGAPGAGASRAGAHRADTPAQEH